VSTLNFDQIVSLWDNAGGDPGWGPLMAGIALAESSGNTTVLNDNPSTGDYSVGLWQINYYGGLLGPRTKAYGSPASLQASPTAQAAAAVSLANGGTNLGPWRTDRAWDQWANAGFPAKPSKATVQEWLKAAGVGTGGGPAGSLAGDPGASTPAGAAGAASQPGADLSTCVIQFPGFLFFSGPCLLTKGGVKWLTGVAALTFGAGVFTFGVVMLAAWGFDRSGAKQAVTSTAKKVGIGASLLTAQPEVAAGIAATSRKPASSGQPATAGRIESRQIERRFRAAERDQGPIGPRGANASSRRAYERRTSTPGGGRRPGAEQRRRATEGHEQRRARHRAEGFERVS
jgi:hypothetical protein